MRLAKSFLTVMALLALMAWVASPLQAQSKAPAKAPQQGAPPPKAGPQAGKQAAPALPSTSQAKPQAPGKAAPTPAAKAQAPAKAAKTPSKAAGAPKETKAAKASKPAKIKPAKEEPPVRVSRRDPFNPLVGKDPAGGAVTQHLPPGKAGLVVSTLRLDGIVRGPNGMIAVVSNPQQRVYFLRENDQLYDGRVEKISMDAVSFHESGKDAFGKPVERQVTKRLYPIPGEQR